MGTAHAPLRNSGCAVWRSPHDPRIGLALYSGIVTRDERPKAKSVSGTLARPKRGVTKETPKPAARHTGLLADDDDSDDIPTRTDGPRLKEETPSLPPVFDFGDDASDDYTNVDDLDFFAETLRKKDSSVRKAVAAPKVDAKADVPAEKGMGGQRLSMVLGQIFRRRREQIGLTLAQLVKLSGISEKELTPMEAGDPSYRMFYDHAVVLARALGVPSTEMPGLRQKTGDKEDPATVIDDMARRLRKGLVVEFEGKGGERYGGEVDRVAVTPMFTVCIGDGSLGDAFPVGTLMAFLNDPHPHQGDIVLLRHRRSKLLALRRLHQNAWAGIQPWQPSYVAGPVGAGADEWLPLGRMVLMVPRGR